MEVVPHNIQKVTDDPALGGLNNQFLAYESHMGQLEYMPAGWHLVATAGEGTLTEY